MELLFFESAKDFSDWLKVNLDRFPAEHRKGPGLDTWMQQVNDAMRQHIQVGYSIVVSLDGEKIATVSVVGKSTEERGYRRQLNTQLCSIVYERNANRGLRNRVTRRAKSLVKPGLQHASAMTGKVFRMVRRNGKRLVAIPHNHVSQAAHAVAWAVDEEGMYERSWMKHGGAVNF